MNSDGILAGTRVLDLSEGIAGAVATRLLAESGADILKVEPPRGDPTRDRAGFATWNRSKRSLALDLATPAGRADLEAFLAVSDVVVHNHPPEVARALGLDDFTLAARCPGLIVCAVTGYPSNHRDAAIPAHDTLVLARSGLMDEQQGWRDGPIFLRMPLGSWGAVYLAACGIVARLIHRDRTGIGGVAHTSLLQGALVPMTMHWARAEAPTAAFSTGIPKDNEPTLFECADGVWIHIMSCPDSTPLMRKSLEELGEMEVARANAAVPANPRYPNVGANRVAFRRHPARAWLEEFWSNDVPAEAAVTMGEIFFDEQAQTNGYVVDVEDAELGATRQAGIPYSTVPAPEVRGPAPRLGEAGGHLPDSWSGAARSAGRRAENGRYPLDGVKVLDLGNFLAGPLALMLIADLGAEVIKLESTGGDQMRWVERVFAGCQRGKRGVAADLKNPQARPVLEALVQWADVVHHNIRMPAARKLGIDEASLRRINPALVYCHTSSYGPAGPRADWPGYDQLFQASCGWELEGAGEGNPPMWHRFGMMDHQCALASLLATLLGLYRRNRTGEGQSVSASLLGAALLTTSETLVLPDGTLAPYPRLDHQQTGTSAGDRIYDVADGWVAVVAPDEQALEGLCRAAGVTSPDELAAAVRSITAADLLPRLEQAGVGAQPVRLNQMDAFFDDQTTWDAGLAVAYSHARYGRLEQVGALWDFGDLDVRLERAAPVIGQHTVEVLRELGFTNDTVVALAAAGAIAGPGLTG